MNNQAKLSRPFIRKQLEGLHEIALEDKWRLNYDADVDMLTYGRKLPYSAMLVNLDSELSLYTTKQSRVTGVLIEDFVDEYTKRNSNLQSIPEFVTESDPNRWHAIFPHERVAAEQILHKHIAEHALTALRVKKELVSTGDHIFLTHERIEKPDLQAIIKFTNNRELIWQRESGYGTVYSDVASSLGIKVAKKLNLLRVLVGYENDEPIDVLDFNRDWNKPPDSKYDVFGEIVLTDAANHEYSVGASTTIQRKLSGLQALGENIMRLGKSVSTFDENLSMLQTAPAQ